MGEPDIAPWDYLTREVQDFAAAVTPTIDVLMPNERRPPDFGNPVIWLTPDIGNVDLNYSELGEGAMMEESGTLYVHVFLKPGEPLATGLKMRKALFDWLYASKERWPVGFLIQSWSWAAFQSGDSDSRLTLSLDYTYTET